jgi:hypothetical protein
MEILVMVGSCLSGDGVLLPQRGQAKNGGAALTLRLAIPLCHIGFPP